MDGVETYNNVSEAPGLEDYGILVVYTDPILTTEEAILTPGKPIHIEVGLMCMYINLFITFNVNINGYC